MSGVKSGVLLQQLGARTCGGALGSKSRQQLDRCLAATCQQVFELSSKTSQ